MLKMFNKGHPEKIFKPMRLLLINAVKSMLVNPRDGKDNGVPEPYAVGSDEYNEELDAVTEARINVSNGVWPKSYFEFCDVKPEPEGVLELAGITMDDPKGAGEFVKMDSPDELWKFVTEWAKQENIPLKYEQPNCIDFLGRNVHAATYFQLLCSERMEYAFEAKGYYLQARPEEVRCENVAQYPCPNHAEAPAGHGTFAGVAFKAFVDLYAAEPWQVESLRQMLLMFAHLRDIAGMHLRQSSFNGFRLGACEIGPLCKVTIPDYITRWAEAA